MNNLKKLAAITAIVMTLGPALALAQTSGDVPVTSGDVPVTSGDVPVTSGDVPVTSGDVATEPLKVNYKVVGNVYAATKDDVTVEVKAWSKGTITDEAVQSWPDEDKDGVYELKVKIKYDAVTTKMLTVVRQEVKQTTPENLKKGAPVVVAGYYVQEEGKDPMFYAEKVFAGAKKLSFKATIDPLGVDAKELTLKVTFVRPPKALKGNKGMTFHVSADTTIKQRSKGYAFSDLKEGQTITVTGYPIYNEKGLLEDVLAKKILVQKLAPGKNVLEKVRGRNK